MADITVEVGLQGTTITLSPDPIVALQGRQPQIKWTAENDHRITEILSIQIQDWPTPQPQPTSNRRVWTVLNSNGCRQRFKYDIKVQAGGGLTFELDPEIDNQGQNGSPPPPPGA